MDKRSMSRLLAPGKNALDGVRCNPMSWSRFGPHTTKGTGGSELFRTLIVDNSISCSIPAPWTDYDVVQVIATQSRTPIPIESLPNELKGVAAPRGGVVFGFSGDKLDQIARNYPNMIWWVSAKGLNMQVVRSSRALLSAFEELAGRLMLEARARCGDRLPQIEYGRIAGALDEKGHKPLEFLEGACRKQLAEWNQNHPRKAIHTFTAAIESKLSWLRRGLKRRLYRVAEKFEKTHPEKLSAG